MIKYTLTVEMWITEPKDKRPALDVAKEIHGHISEILDAKHGIRVMSYVTSMDSGVKSINGERK